MNFFGLTRHFEANTKAKTGITDHESTAWEDVDQVVERIRESGGKLVAHARRPRENGTGYEYTSTVIFGNETELELPLKDAMSKLLSE